MPLHFINFLCIFCIVRIYLNANISKQKFWFHKKYAFKKSGFREKLTMVYLLHFLPFSKLKSQVCTVELDVRELEQRSMKLIPNVVWMKSETVLTQYIITGWALVYRNQSKVNL